MIFVITGVSKRRQIEGYSVKKIKIKEVTVRFRLKSIQDYKSFRKFTSYRI